MPVPKRVRLAMLAFLELQQNTYPIAKEDGIISFSDCTNAPQNVQTCITYFDAGKPTICHMFLLSKIKTICTSKTFSRFTQSLLTGFSPSTLSCSRLGPALHQTVPGVQDVDHVLCHGTCLIKTTKQRGDGRSSESHMESHG